MTEDRHDNYAYFQRRVASWMLECFSTEIAEGTVERNDRFIEEALELIQACGGTAERAHALVDYVFGRQVGEPYQEVGGVMVTLAALCCAHAGLDMECAAETELARILEPDVILKIRAKQAAKPTGSALPIAMPVRNGSAIADIAAERQRQLSVKGWTPEHDDEHNHGEMAMAAAAYAVHAALEDEEPALNLWPWELEWWKPKDRRRDLVRAGALIVAEIERLDRAEAKEGQAHD